MKALSVRPPWAWAIAHAGKRVENRSWTTRYRGPLLVHASGRYTPKDLSALERVLRRKIDPEVFCSSAIVARANLVDVVLVQKCRSRWAVGPYCWLLEGVEPLDRPIVAKGRLGLWMPSPSIAHRARADKTVCT